MKRKVTALLLAMTFVFATVAPTMAASKQASASSNKTATVSVEKSKDRGKLGAFFAKLLPLKKARSVARKEAAGNNEVLRETNPSENNSENSTKEVTNPQNPSENGGTTNPVNPGTKNDGKASEGSKGEKTGQEEQKKEDKVEPVEFTFSLIGESNEPLSGAAFILKNVTNKEASVLKDSWITDGNPKPLKLEPGKYQLKMTERPKGYKETSAEFEIEIVKSEKPGEPDKFNIISKTLTFDKDGKKLTMKAEKEPEKEKEEIKLFFSLRGIDDKDLAGANVTIKQDGNTFNGTFVTKDQPTELPRDKGEYELIVTKLPDGYKLEKDTIKFEIKEDGKLVPVEADKEYLETKDGNYTLFLKAEPVEPQVFFGLKDSNGKGIVGLELKIQGNNGKVISLVSGERAIGVNLSELPDGAYVFSQTNVRYGYEAAEPIQFTMKDGKVISASSGLTNFGPYQELTLVSKSAKRVVTFSRVDSLGKILLGVEIEIYKDGTKIDSWKSGSDHHKLELEAGVYRYHEAAVVLGHKIAKDFEFEVKTDGSIVLRGIQLGENVKLKEGGHICVGEAGGKLEEDPNKKPEEKPGQSNQKKPTNDKKAQAKNHWVEFDVAKKDGTLLEGAVVEIYQNGKLLESWTTSNTGYKTQLQPGSYRFHTKTAPQGYQLARDFNFAVNRDGSITLGKLQSGDTVTAKDGRIVVYGDPISATGTRTSGTTTAAASNGRLPKTGDGISPVFYAVGLAAVGAVILGIGIKKRRESVDEVK